MDDKVNGSRYLPNPSGLNNLQDYCSSFRPKVAEANSMYPRAGHTYPGDEEEDLVDEESGDEDVETNVVKMIGNNTDDDDDDDDDDEEEEEDSDDEEVELEDIGIGRTRKKRKLKTLISNYEFAPRVPIPPVQKAKLSEPSSGGQNSVGDWAEQETFSLLDAWGERFVSLGRKSLRAEEWQEVAEMVSRETNIKRSDVQCRQQLDTLKKKYKKEKTRLMSGTNDGCRWVFYRKMDMLLSSSTPQQQIGLSCGIDSGEYVFMNPDVYLNRANGLDEMRDSPENSASLKDDDSDGLPPKAKRKSVRRVDGGSSFRLLADSIYKFSEIYEKMESNKRKQMEELENMRMEFHRQLEAQRRQILERAQAEIVKIRRTHDCEKDLSAETLSV